MSLHNITRHSNVYQLDDPAVIVVINIIFQIIRHTNDDVILYLFPNGFYRIMFKNFSSMILLSI